MTRLKLLSTAIATAMLLCLPPARHALGSLGAQLDSGRLDGASLASARR